MTAVRKGRLSRVDGVEEVLFAFNPQTLTMKKSASWRATPQRSQASAPKPQFVGAEASSVELQVLFDAWAAPSPTVARSVEVLMSWTCPAPATLTTQRPQPPLVRLDWGGLPSALTCYVKSVSATYLLFDDQGQPTRATVDLVLQETPEETARQNPTSGGEPGTRQRTVVGGDSLQSLAQEEYGDPGLWPALAEANGIDDPLRLPTGRLLLVPPRTTARARLSEAPRA